MQREAVLQSSVSCLIRSHCSHLTEQDLRVNGDTIKSEQAPDLKSGEVDEREGNVLSKYFLALRTN